MERSLREKRIIENRPLVISIVKRFMNRGVETADLIQIGMLGLIKAADRFDESYNVRFSTYAVPVITGEIKRFFRDDGMIRVSRILKEKASVIKQAKEEYTKSNGCEAPIEELSKITGFSVDEILMAEESSLRVESLDAALYEDDITLQEKIGGTENNEEKLLDRIALRDAIKELPEKDRKLIALRYYSGLTQTATAKLLGMTQVQVFRREKKILEILKKGLT